MRDELTSSSKKEKEKRTGVTLNTSPLLTIAPSLQRSFLSNVVHLFFWDFELMPKHLTKKIMQIIIKNIFLKISMKAEFKVYILGGSNVHVIYSELSMFENCGSKLNKPVGLVTNLICNILTMTY